MMKTAMLALCALIMSACASTPARPTTPAAPPGHQADAPPPERSPDAGAAAPSAGSRLSMSLPDGWGQVPSERVPEGMTGMLINPSLRAIIMVFTDTGAASPADSVTALAGQLTAGGGWTAAAVQTSPDGNTAWVTVDNGSGTHGRILVRRLRASPAFSLVLMGQWPAASDAGGAAGIEALAASAAIE